MYSCTHCKFSLALKYCTVAFLLLPFASSRKCGAWRRKYHRNNVVPQLNWKHERLPMRDGTSAPTPDRSKGLPICASGNKQDGPHECLYFWTAHADALPGWLQPCCTPAFKRRILASNAWNVVKFKFEHHPFTHVCSRRQGRVH